MVVERIGLPRAESSKAIGNQQGGRWILILRLLIKEQRGAQRLLRMRVYVLERAHHRLPRIIPLPVQQQLRGVVQRRIFKGNLKDPYEENIDHRGADEHGQRQSAGEPGGAATR